MTIAVTLGLMVALTLFLRRTSFGIQMRAAAEDFRMARYLGVRANFVIGLDVRDQRPAGCNCVAAVRFADGDAQPTLGQPIAYSLYRGCRRRHGSLLGAVLGGFVIGLIVVMLQAYLPPDLRVFRDAFAFAFVILVLVVKPSGLIRAKGMIERV